MNALSALSASVLLRLRTLAIDSTSSPLFTGRTSTHGVCRGNENVFIHEVKHFRFHARHIHHFARVLCNACVLRALHTRLHASTMTMCMSHVCTPMSHARRISTMTSTLDDGDYEAFILWVEKRDDGLALECTITAGPHRGDVVNLASSLLRVHDELALVGMPCTLVVTGDTIRVDLT